MRTLHHLAAAFVVLALSPLACSSSEAGDPGALDGDDGGPAGTPAPSTTVTPASTAAPVPSVAIRGVARGVLGTGLVLQNNAGDDLPISANGSFLFKGRVPRGAPYAVRVAHEPSSPTQTCIVAEGSGTTGNVDVGDVELSCATSAYSVGGNAIGLASTAGLVLRNNGGDDLAVKVEGNFAFAQAVESGKPFSVTIVKQPLGQTCVVAGKPSGIVVSSNVTTADVVCSSFYYSIGGSVTGLLAPLRLQNLGGDDLVVAGSGKFTFATPLIHDTGYDVSIAAQPSNPNQVCSITGGNGTVLGANVTNVQIACVTTPYLVSVHASGVAGTGLSLKNNGGAALAITADGDYTFALPVPDGQPYDISVSAQPSGPDQICVVQNGTGKIAGGDVTGPIVVCN